MSEKTFYFHAGLPRSGSTLLTALLNQHPKIYASEHSQIRNLMANLDRDIPELDSWRANYRRHGFNNIIKEVANSFYFDIEKPIVIDKDRNWGTPFSLEFAKFINPEIKFIVTLRPILEILASFINLMDKNPENLYDNWIKNNDFFPKYYKSVNDTRCDYLMDENGFLGAQIFSVVNLMRYPNNICIVWYDNLVNNTQKELEKIYSFLEIDSHTVNTKNISALEKLNDLDAFGIKDLHEIKPKLQKSKTDYSSVLSDYVIKKYGGALDFLNDLLPENETFNFIYPNTN